MNKKQKAVAWLGFYLLVGCNPQTPGITLPAQLTSALGAGPAAIGTESPNAQPSLTPTPSLVPSTPTATVNPGAISHLASGSAVDVTFVQMLDGKNGWGVGGVKKSNISNHVLRTTDGGITWLDVTPPEQADATDSASKASAVGFFPDINTAWVTIHGSWPAAVPAAPIVWKTMDGGLHWIASAPFDTTDLEVFTVSDILFSGPSGWVLAHVGAGMNHDYIALYHSTDSGMTWSRIMDPVIDGGVQSCSKTGIYFKDKSNGWLTGDCNGVAPGALLFQTADAGQTWQPVLLPAPSDRKDLFTAMEYACGIRAPVAFASTLYLVVECDVYTGATQGFASYLYTSTNNGLDWSYLPYPGGEFRTTDGFTGWALGKDIFRTVDGGMNWEKIQTVTWDGRFNFVSASMGFAIAQKDGEFGLVQTADGGRSWVLLAPVIAAGQ